MMDRHRLAAQPLFHRLCGGVGWVLSGCHARRWSLVGGFAAVCAALIIAFSFCWFAFPFPLERFDRQTDNVLVTDRHGRVLLEVMGPSDQRRRTVARAQMSPWLIQAAVAVEDERFHSHYGVDVVALIRAVSQNLWSGKIVSGASTISMQVCKMMDDRPRSWQSKLIEAFRALQLERLKSKSEILAAYLNRIPCGGNLCGVESAAQAYFGKSSAQLSLGEAALLAGLPQSPNRFAPDRHPDAARRRRETVLRRMFERGEITASQRDQALAEPLDVLSRTPRPPVAIHAAWMAMARRPAGGRTTIDLDLQAEVQSHLQHHAAGLPEGADAAVVVIDVAQSEIVALVGSADERDPKDGQVNGAIARRSPGSALKPFLYAAAFEARRLAPESMIDDIPIERAGWSPENFDRTFRGPVTAAEALRQSLNVPAITITEGLGLPRCLGLLEAMGCDLPANAESRGGLAVATGGLEVTLLQLTNAYATLARDGVRTDAELLFHVDQVNDSPRPQNNRRTSVLNANVCRAIASILSSDGRCPRGWESLPADRRPWCIWKTGTSSGRRDAWAVGHNGRYAIGVWIGFFSGAGHREFVGRDSAEPLLAALFASTPFVVDAQPITYEPWRVDHPLPRPIEASGTLAILTPRNDAAFLAWNGSTVIHPKATTREPITWFHNGRVLSVDEASRLVVPRGAHELRAIVSTGQSASVKFTVK